MVHRALTESAGQQLAPLGTAEEVAAARTEVGELAGGGNLKTFPPTP